MDFVGIVSAHQAAVVVVYLGVWITVTRLALAIRPASTLRFLSLSLQREKHVRGAGALFLIAIGMPMVWAGLGNQTEPLGQVLLILGLVGIVAFSWMVLHPGSFGRAFSELVTRPANADYGGWRVLGITGALIGLAIALVGWRNL